MPELAEVEFFRKRWCAGRGDKVLSVQLHAGKKVFRNCDTQLLANKLTGARLLNSETAAKQMLFRFSTDTPSATTASHPCGQSSAHSSLITAAKSSLISWGPLTLNAAASRVICVFILAGGESAVLYFPSILPKGATMVRDVRN